MVVVGKFPLLWTPTHSWRGAADVSGSLGKETALFPEPVLDGIDLLDAWLGEPKNPDGFWVSRMGLMDGDCCQVTGYLVRS